MIALYTGYSVTHSLPVNLVATGSTATLHVQIGPGESIQIEMTPADLMGAHDLVDIVARDKAESECGRGAAGLARKLEGRGKK